MATEWIYEIEIKIQNYEELYTGLWRVCRWLGNFERRVPSSGGGRKEVAVLICGQL